MATSAPLDRDAIVEAAVDITRHAGLSALTMRAVGARFGVTAMALYRHVANREELVRLVANQIGTLVRPQVPDDADWHDRARAWAVAQRAVLRQHPGVAAWLMQNGPAGTEAYRLLELLTASLADAELDDATVARGSALIMSWTFSRISIEDSADARRAADQPSRAGAFVTGLDQIDPTEHPTAARVGPTFFTLGMEEIFDTGLDWILAGIGVSAGRVPEEPPSAQPPDARSPLDRAVERSGDARRTVTQET
ncbi:TetR/AcrR family transcriptional regulator C-terminal domain-containing protein [Actinotalea sp. BY-33]|uniref:TetR/AcrR family transcriptional regulator C-terminal domain-containing protein n=1 Tax=Actinotalea soli TaxID=2819234 RepID=A0A939LRV3_9CELL|nr:TetR/AcrR family transcriptional regulator [Actinotalea soli]MBO1752923.1 TetR/AcrR family transcriptional regulator C-terminal domain-containing protein [Actinotalea soli]